MFYYEFRAMNSHIQFAADGEASAVSSGFAQARQLVDAYEKRFTRFSPDSELSHLNQFAEAKPGAWFKASPEFFEVMQLAQRLMRQTSGLFDPAILPALRQAGYDRSMDELRQAGPQFRPEHPGPAARQNFSQARLDPANHAIALPAGMQIDLGGIAKGWIAEQAARRLKLFSTCCVVNAGGDMFMVGLPAGQDSWKIGLEDPRDPDRDIAMLSIQAGAVTTSSITKRRWVQNGKQQHHLIDPRSGQPAETDWLSVTVFADHTADAEVFSKALLIAGSKQASLVAHQQSIKSFIAVDRENKIWKYDNLAPQQKENIHVEYAYA